MISVADLLNFLTYAVSFFSLWPFCARPWKNWKSLPFFSLLGLQWCYSLKYLEYFLLFYGFDLTPMRLRRSGLLIERTVFLLFILLFCTALHFLLHRKLCVLRYLNSGLLQILLTLNSGTALAFSVYMNRYSAQNRYTLSSIVFNAVFLTAYSGLTLLMFLFIYQILKKQADIEKRRILYENLRAHIDDLESWNAKMRIFKHDYTNLLLSAHLYLEKEDWDSLEIFYEEHLLPFSQTYAGKAEENRSNREGGGKEI